MYDKRKEFEVIEEKLNEIRILCNRLMIPFFWIAAVKDSETGTDYRVALDENTALNNYNHKYRCNALVPGSMGVPLQDDLIRDMIKVLNGFKVVPDETPIATFGSNEFSLEALFPEVPGRYTQDDEGNFILDETSAVNQRINEPIVVPELEFGHHHEAEKGKESDHTISKFVSVTVQLED